MFLPFKVTMLSEGFADDYSIMTGTTIAALICLGAAGLLLILKIVLSIWEDKSGSPVVSFFTGVFIAAGVVCLMIPNAKIVETSDSRNQQISSILLEKYGAELVEPIYTHQERGTIGDLTDTKHEIWNAEGQSQTISIKLTENKKDLIASTGGGELPKLDKIPEVHPIN